MRRDLQSPQRRGGGRFPGLSNADSPGDVEASQDIFWDSTSPTNPNTGLGPRNTRVVEISDIVNRIAPKDLRPRGTESPLLQWFGDSAVSCTPEVPKPRPRRRSSRQSSVEDLKKLARQFDENMQQDKDEHLNTINNNLKEQAAASSSRAEPAETSLPDNANKCLSSTDPVEAELQALFDCSTQKVSGRLSQASSRSSCSQRAAAAAGEKVKAGNCDDFDDDWENDDLLNDSFMLAMTQNPKLQETNANRKTPTAPHGKRNANPASSVSKPATSAPSVKPVPKSKGSTLQELCPKTKTTNRSTFKLGPDPRLRPPGAARDDLKSQASEQKSSPAPRPPVPAHSANDASDSLWDDDALFFELCDPVERLSNSQPPPPGPGATTAAHHRPPSAKTTAPLPIDTGRPTNAARQSPCTFVRSKSLPETRREDFRGWNVPLKGGSGGGAIRPRMSQSLPGSRLGGGAAFGQSFGTSRAADTKPHTVTARTPQEPKPHHGASKRNVPETAVISSKVFVTSQKTAKCSAAEIERKKQEALARRRLRMQNAQKP